MLKCERDTYGYDIICFSLDNPLYSNNSVIGYDSSIGLMVVESFILVCFRGRYEVEYCYIIGIIKVVFNNCII